jgi:MJ1316 RNA cyclic group end recognition domain
MVPIQKLLSRIRWDADFARGQFELGHFDRVEDRVMVVPFQTLEFPPEDLRSFRLTDAEGRFHRVPFH